MMAAITSRGYVVFLETLRASCPLRRTIGIQWYISKYSPTKNLTLKYMYTAITSYHPHHYIGVHALVVCGLTLPTINLKDISIIL